MGSPVSSIVADICIEEFEEKSITKETSVTPRLWKRFVDDILAVVRMDKSHKPSEHLDRQHPSVRFTMEEEGKGVLPFMDAGFSAGIFASRRKSRRSLPMSGGPGALPRKIIDFHLLNIHFQAFLNSF